MTLKNLKHALYLNNVNIINLINRIQEKLNNLNNFDISTIKNNIDELQTLISKAKEDIENLNDTTITGINQKIIDIQNDISNLQAKDIEVTEYVDIQITDLITDINQTISDIRANITNLAEAINTHMNNTVIHVTSDDKELWNAALDNAKDYAKSLFDGLTSFTVNIVEKLPDNPISMVIYFVPNSNGDTSDFYDEYMYIDSKWEKIGATYVNLEPYALKTDLHTHSNKTVIDKFTDVNGKVLYNGSEIVTDQITISKEKDNAIETKKDGIYVEDKEDIIQELRHDVNIASKHSKYINTELEYFQAYGDDTVGNANSMGHVTVPFRENILKYFNVRKTNMKIVNDTVKLTKGKTYQLTATVLVQINIPAVLCVFIDTNGYGYPNAGYASAKNNSWDRTNPLIVVTPKEDIYMKLQMQDEENKTPNCVMHFGLSSVFIQEINRQIEIDPVEYVNEDKGLEDSPIGHIISFMGTIIPKHYLACDGAVYNILEYPNLANHFLDNFGRFNYFGGDGIKTFAVPDLRNEFLRGYHGTAKTLSGDIGKHQEATKHVWFSHMGDASLIQYRANQKLDNITAMDIDSSDIGIMYRNTQKFANSDIDKEIYYNPQRYTGRPTNTAVNYCIKYESTYFMNINKQLVGRTQDVLFEGEIRADGDYELYHKLSNYDELLIIYSSEIKKELVVNNNGGARYCEFLIDVETALKNSLNDSTLPPLQCVILNQYLFNEYNTRIGAKFTNDKVQIMGITDTGYSAPCIYKISGIKYEPTYSVNIDKQAVGVQEDILFEGHSGCTGYNPSNIIYDDVKLLYDYTNYESIGFYLTVFPEVNNTTRLCYQEIKSSQITEMIELNKKEPNKYHAISLLYRYGNYTITSDIIENSSSSILKFVHNLSSVTRIIGLNYIKVPKQEQITDLDVDLAISDVITLLNSDELPEVSPELQAAISDTINILNK